MRVLSVNTMIHQKSTQFLNFHAIRVPSIPQANSQVYVSQNVQLSDLMRIWRYNTKRRTWKTAGDLVEGKLTDVPEAL